MTKLEGSLNTRPVTVGADSRGRKRKGSVGVAPELVVFLVVLVVKVEETEDVVALGQPLARDVGDASAGELGGDGVGLGGVDVLAGTVVVEVVPVGVVGGAPGVALGGAVWKKRKGSYVSHLDFLLRNSEITARQASK